MLRLYASARPRLAGAELRRHRPVQQGQLGRQVTRRGGGRLPRLTWLSSPTRDEPLAATVPERAPSSGPEQARSSWKVRRAFKPAWGTIGHAARGSSDYALQHLRCTPLSCGLLLPPDLTRDDWAAVGRALARQQHALQWRIGDWWNHPGHAYGDRMATVTVDDWMGPSYSTCANAGSVCDKFESSRLSGSTGVASTGLEKLWARPGFGSRKT
jgi:hypothetical protein